MKLRACLFLVLCSAANAALAVANATAGVGTNSGATCSKSYVPSNSASLLLMSINMQNNSPNFTISSVTDGTNGTWTAIDSGTTSGHFSDTWAYYVKNTTTSSITISGNFTGAGTVGACSMSIIEFTGFNTTTPIGNHSSGSLGTGSATDIVTAANVNASAGDALVLFGGNYYAPTWAAGATNPSSPTPTSRGAYSGGAGNSNTTVWASLLTVSYTGKVSLNPGAGVNDYGSVIGVQVNAGAAGTTAIRHRVSGGL